MDDDDATITPPLTARQLLGGALAGALVGAVMGGALWWFVNGMAKVNNIGWLARLPWPISQFWSFSVVGAAVGGVARVVTVLHNRRRTLEVAAMGQRLALDFAAEAVQEGRVDTPAFQHWSDGSNRMAGEVAGVPVEMFDLKTVVPGSDSSTIYQRTIIVLPAPELPTFDLRARRGALRWLARLGMTGMQFDAAAASAADAETVREFSQSCILTPTELTAFLTTALSPDAAPAVDDTPLRRLFSLALMRTCVERPGWSIESRPGQLVLWRGEGYQAAANRPGLLNEALELRDALLQAAANPAANALPPPSGQETKVHTAGMTGSVLGGVLGMVAGFFVGGGIASALFFRRGAGGFGGPAQLLSMFIPFGLAALSAFLGAILGRLIVRRLAARGAGLPDDPEYARRRKRNASIGGVSGLFVGFFGGAFGGVALGETLGGNFDQFWFTALLFFSGAGLGLAGGVLLGIAVGLAFTRRKTAS